MKAKLAGVWEWEWHREAVEEGVLIGNGVGEWIRIRASFVPVFRSGSSNYVSKETATT